MMGQKDKNRKIKLIINTGAGDPAEVSNKIKLVSETFQELGLTVDTALAKPKKEAIPIVKKAVKDGYQTVIAMGGDGTLETVLRAMMDTKSKKRKKVHFGILPAGTSNNIARSIGIPLDLKEACQLIAQDETQKMDVGRTKTKKHKPFYFFELTAIGLTAAIYPDAKDIMEGDLEGLKNTVSTLFKLEANPKVKIKINEESKIKVHTLLVTVSNTPAFGKNFLVAPEASLQDGLLDISIFPDFNKADLLVYYAKVMNEGENENEKIQRYRAKKLKIKTKPKLDVMADGVMLGKGTTHIKIFPGALHVITSPKAEGLATEPDPKSEDMAPLPE